MLRLGPVLRLRFAVRLTGIRGLCFLIAIATRLRWPWLVFNLMALQRRLGWRYEI